MAKWFGAAGDWHLRSCRIGLSILSGSHLELVPGILRLLADEGVDATVVLGRHQSLEVDRVALLASGIAAICTPKDFELRRIMNDIATLAEARRSP